MAREWRVERDGDEEERHNERWLVTYADLMTVLLIFFIVMYSLSSKISAKNFERLAKSLNTSLTKKEKVEKAVDPFTPDVAQEAELAEESKVIKKALAPFEGKSQVKVDLNSKGIVISLADTSFFDLGSTEIKPEGRTALLSIARAIATESNAISVEGHTDSVRGAGGKATSNWVIAATRAANVAQFLSEAGKVPAKRFEIVSYGEFKPLFPNDTPEHRAMNRRVDIVIQEGAPKPAITPKPEASVDTLAPAFGDPNDGRPANPFNRNPNEGGTGIPNPFGNNF
ncbi:MAG TPA: flagellar motor protein MotB [Pantanalinema sp.]